MQIPIGEAFCSVSLMSLTKFLCCLMLSTTLACKKQGQESGQPSSISNRTEEKCDIKDFIGE
jgi:hypothetical protein